MNFAWIDVETTGVHADKHDVIQVACIPVVNGVEYEPFNQFCKPKNWDAIEEGAIQAHGITREMMREFQSQEKLLDHFVEYLRNLNVKLVIAGYNVSFDKRFLSALFSNCGRSEDFFSFFELHVHDTYNRVKKVKSQINTENNKLETLAKHYGVEINAHDALSDIRATIHVDAKIGELLGEETQEADIQVENIECPDFPEMAQLHLHSMYGMVESIPSIDDWVEWCKDSGVPAFSIVDHGNAISLHEMLKVKDVTAIPGAGLYFSYDELLCPFNAWAISNTGYFNLMKLASLGYDNVEEDDGIERPVLHYQTLIDHPDLMEGMVFGSADVYGAIGNSISYDDAETAERVFAAYVGLFGDALRVELLPVSITNTYSTKTGFQKIKRNSLVVDGDLNKAFNIFMLDMAEKYDVDVVPVSGAHFIAKSDKLLQDVVSKNSYDSGKTYIESYHARNTADVYVALKQQLGDRLTPDRYRGWISNTLEVAEGASSIEIEFDFHMPEIEIPEHIREQADDYDEQTLLYTIELCKKHGRWRDDPEYVERFKKEIGVIMKNGTLNFLPYFLLYEDICSYARSQGILQNIGRGSAGGCLLSYYLKIIHVDPIQTDLPFERFLSVARINAGSFPDIDCDFGDRTLILEYLKEKYSLGFAQICTFQKMKTKNAIKDAMWALYGKNRKDPNVEYVCSFIPDSPQGVDEYDFLYGFTNKEGEYTPGLVETVPEVARFFEQFNQVEAMVKRLIGLIRGWGRHASAFVISTLDLASTRVPTMGMWDNHLRSIIPVTQYEASMVEDCGLVKADILGVKTIQAVSDCIKLIKERTGIDYLEEGEDGVAKIYSLPDDSDVYGDFYKKRTDSSFQFNTPLIKGYIQQFVPTQREHLSAMTALCRPGALDAPFVNDEISVDDNVSAAQYYMDVRNGRRELSYLHPDLSSCTSNGVFVYQEEVMKFLVDVVGYTLEESDRIRNAIAKKKHDVMMSTFDKIRKATSDRGWSSDKSDAVCDQVQAFSRYSFNRSHARCYGELGYITMYLKHHHKLEWWTAELNNTPKEDKLRHYISLLGDLVQSPSLDNPSRFFTIKDNRVVAPLSVLKRVGGAAVDELSSKGPFESLDDYIERVQHSKVNVGHFSSLIKGRAADCLMDDGLDYSDARAKLLEDYVKKRRCNPFKEELHKTDPMSVFLMERETNKMFNKSILDDPSLRSIIVEKDDNIYETGRKGVPLMYNTVPVLANCRVAEALLEKGHDELVSMIMLFEGSHSKSGKSKRTGRPYAFVKAGLSDGYSDVECIWWDKKEAFGWPINSIVLVSGYLKEGWNTSVDITVEDIRRLT